MVLENPDKPGNGNTPAPNPFAASGLFMSTADLWTPFKMSFEGFAGGGKTFTMCLIALAIWLREGKTGKIVLIDTERSAKFIIPFFRQFGLVEGQNFFVTYSRDLRKFGEILKMCEAERGTILLIDTVTHIYEQMMVQFEIDNKRKVKYPGDAMLIKPMWKDRFSTPFVEALNTHILFTGRAAWEYTMDVDDDGKKSFNATGVKMRGDNEMAYEPDVVVLMERSQKIENGQVYTARHCTIMKDRSRLIDGNDYYFVPDKLNDDGSKQTDQQKMEVVWKVFQPVYEFIASGNSADKPATEADKKLGPLFQKNSGEEWYRQKVEAEKIVEEIISVYSQWAMGGSGSLEKSLRANINQRVYDCRATESLKDLSPQELRDNFDVLEHLVRFAAKSNEVIEKMFKAGQYESIGELLDEQKKTYLKAFENAPVTKVDPEDDIADFSAPKDKPTEAESNPYEEVAEAGKPAETSQEPGQTGPLAKATEESTLTSQPGAQASQEKVAELIDAVQRDHVDKLVAKIEGAGTAAEIDALMLANVDLLNEIGLEPNKRVDSARRTRKAQLRRMKGKDQKQQDLGMGV